MLLPDPMTKTAIIFSAEFRQSGYTVAEEQQLRGLLESLGAVRLRADRLPAAGGSTELWLVASFIGGSMASGLIGHITTNVYDRLSAQLLAFFRIRKQRDGVEPEMTLTVSYDDVDLALGPVSEDEVSRLPKLARRVHEVLSAPPLRDSGVTKIVIGMVRDAEGWAEPHLQNQPEDSGRFWGISLSGHRQITHIFDSETNLLAPRPDLPRG